MAYNGAGLFSRLYSWVNDAANGINIRADRMDQEMDGFAQGLSNCITRDGQGKPSSAIDWNNQDLTNVRTLAVTGAATAATPTTGDRSTRLATTQMFANEFGLSAAGNGYQKLPSGLILQWGAGSTGVGGVANVTFPIAFPTAAYFVNAVLAEGSPNPFIVGIGGPSTTNVPVYASTAAGAGLSGVGFFWFAIGN
jgi:hypothetical protein